MAPPKFQNAQGIAILPHLDREEYQNIFEKAE